MLQCKASIPNKTIKKWHKKSVKKERQKEATRNKNALKWSMIVAKIRYSSNRILPARKKKPQVFDSKWKKSEQFQRKQELCHWVFFRSIDRLILLLFCSMRVLLDVHVTTYFSSLIVCFVNDFRFAKETHKNQTNKQIINHLSSAWSKYAPYIDRVSLHFIIELC